MPRSILLRTALLLGAAVPCLAFAADSDLTIETPYVRLAPPGAPATGAFMILRNASNVERRLVKAESPTVARLVQLHNHINEDGVMKMREVPEIKIAANGQAELKPGSYHIMLIDLKQELKEGHTVPITLNFDDGTWKQLEVPIRKLQMTLPADKEASQNGKKH